MKTIEDLTVTVTYTVSYSDVEVPDDVYEQLINNSTFSSGFVENQEVLEWLAENINEEDAMDWTFEVDDIE